MKTKQPEVETMHWDTQEDDSQLYTGIFLISIGTLLLVRGIKQGEVLILTGITMLADYFNLEERMGEFFRLLQHFTETISWDSFCKTVTQWNKF